MSGRDGDGQSYVFEWSRGSMRVIPIVHIRDTGSGPPLVPSGIWPIRTSGPDLLRYLPETLTN